MNENNYSKLPRWAQTEINRLKADCEYWKEKARQIAGDQETNVYIDNLSEQDTPLPANSIIKFVLKDGFVRVRHQGDIIELHGVSDEKKIAIRPYVTNSIYLQFI